MKFERIMRSGIVVDGTRPGDDPRLTLEDLSWALEAQRWGGHHPDRVTIAQHSLAMARLAGDLGMTSLDKLACLWHDVAETFMSDLPTTLKHQPEMAYYRRIEDECRDSLVARFAPALVGYDWVTIKPLDRASLTVEFQRFPETPDREAHGPGHHPTLGMTWERHYTGARCYQHDVATGELKPYEDTW